MEVSMPMDLVPRAGMSPRAHPETLMRSNTTSKAPRVLPPGIPGLPHPKHRRIQSQPKPSIPIAPPEPTPIKINPWRLTREFDEILGPYPYEEPELVEPEISATESDVQAHQQETSLNYESSSPPQQPEPRQKQSMDSMADQRETLNIAYDPNWTRQPQRQPENSETQTGSHPPPNRFDLGYFDKKSRPVVTEQETGSESPAERPYQSDWIAAETQDITDRTYYDADADNAYTHQAIAVRAAAPKMIDYSASTDKEFERPRQVPAINPRSTRIVLKEDIAFLTAVRDGTAPLPAPARLPVLPKAEEGKARSSLESVSQDDLVRQQDVDFFMSLLDGSDPPRASPETELLVQEEEEMRRRSEAAAAEEVERRRLEEMETTRNDLDFLAALLQ